MRAHPPSLNYQKHTSRNPLLRWLLGRFQERVAGLVAQATQGAHIEKPRLLDVGCGEGFVLHFLAGRLPGLHLYGVDSGMAALKLARRLNPHLPLCRADATALPFPTGSFHLVLCLEVLEHLPDPIAALEELKRVSSGSLLLSVPHQPFFALANLLRGKNLVRLGEDVEHLHHWRAAQFLDLVGSRVCIEKVVYSFPWLITLAAPLATGIRASSPSARLG